MTKPRRSQVIIPGHRIRPAELARRRGVTRQFASRELHQGSLVGLLGDDGRVDSEHPRILAWVMLGKTESGGDRDAKPSRRGKVVRLDDSRDRAELTEIALRDRRARAKRHEGEARRIELQIAREEGALISRELVRVHVLGAIEAAHRRLLSDWCISLATQLPALASRPIDARVRVLQSSVELILSAAIERMTAALGER